MKMNVTGMIDWKKWLALACRIFLTIIWSGSFFAYLCGAFIVGSKYSEPEWLGYTTFSIALAVPVSCIATIFRMREFYYQRKFSFMFWCNLIPINVSMIAGAIILILEGFSKNI